MKKVTLILAAFALVLGLSQCKKQETPAQSGEKQHKLNVIKIDMNAEFMSNHEEFLQVMQRRIMKDFAKAFPDVDFSDCRSFADCMLEVYAEKKRDFRCHHRRV